MSNVRETSTSYWDGVAFYSSEGFYHDQTLFKNGEVQLFRYQNRRDVEITGFTCTSTVRYHYANGEVQPGENSYECTPV